MDPPKPLIVTVDDDADLAALIGLHVRRWGYAAAIAGSAAQLWQLLARRVPDVLLLDVMLGDADGCDLVAEVKDRLPDLPVIMITRSVSVDAAVRCMKRGAADYITKPLDFSRLAAAVAAAAELARLARRVTAAGQARQRQEFGGLLGGSPPMVELYQLLENVAANDVSALILGETGTGKELVARAIHAASARAAGPFVAVNAAAIPHELIESALFGHQKGAFTGAQEVHVGTCEQADGGTLFLDEIGEMHFDVQAKLLRFLQDHVVQRVGARSGRHVDVRVLAATNADIAGQIAARKLREDLYYRLRVVTLRLPPLRERQGDIALLAQHFLHRAAARAGRAFARLSPAALRVLAGFPWPGNVRQLENVIEEAVVLHRGEELTAAMLPLEIRDPSALAPAAGSPHRGAGGAPAASPSGATAPGVRGEPLTEREAAARQAVRDALARCGWDPNRAARELGISRATIYRKMRRYGL